MSKKSVFIVAGELSGDIHAAHLIKALKQQCPTLHVEGLGGEHMQQAGCLLHQNMMDLAVVGFVEVLKNITQFKQLMNKTVEVIQKNKPDVVVLIDYPGFNLRLAQKIKPLGCKIVYYISPQVWAWHKGRVKELKKLIDKICVIFPFEEVFFHKEGVSQASFVGHPLLDQEEFLNPPSREYQQVHSKPEPLLALLPGSRIGEIKRNLPCMLESLCLLDHSFRCAIGVANQICEREIKAIVAEYAVKVDLENNARALMRKADFGLIASGTATLEAACLYLPMAVIYRVNWLTWGLAKLFVKIKHIGIVNIIMGREVVPEFIQQNAVPENAAQFINDIYRDKNRYEKMIQDLIQCRKELGASGASENAAKCILELMSQGA